MKKIISILLALICLVLLLTACSTKSSNNENTNASANQNMSSNKSKLDILIQGKKVRLPFDFSVLTDLGYTFTDSDVEAKVFAADDKVIRSVGLVNNTVYQKVNIINPYLDIDVYCKPGSANSMKGVSVVEVFALNLDKEIITFNGFGCNDSTKSFIESFGPNYKEIAGTYNDNINSGTYIFVYVYDDVTITVKSDDGLLESIDARMVTN